MSYLHGWPWTAHGGARDQVLADIVSINVVDVESMMRELHITNRHDRRNRQVLQSCPERDLPYFVSLDRLEENEKTRQHVFAAMRFHLAWNAYLDRCWANAGAASVRRPRHDPDTCADEADDLLAMEVLGR